MKNTRTPQTTLAIALATGLMFAAGGAMANDPAQAQHADHAIAQDSTLTNTEQLDRADSDQPGTDTWITTKVKASLLADSDTAGTQIEVETNNGVVGLSGNLDSQAQVDAAKRIAEGIEGVTEVDASDLHYGTMADYEE
ncbi:BON domain-containing protein [Lysobacter sp. GX 14042]|uniref:BON domain-containing protein n=1 Tax=Lysobacter sp. GX 14042 TaxID=2907155 RepID=UPI001F2E4C23|nr:BON domain-containing protein [Lysobacter sp. GX 14042]MCE7032166.1 BON domain-containing protein [Lysobacter sp. GX 14042]